jgi:hypothetical protein
MSNHDPPPLLNVPDKDDHSEHSSKRSVSSIGKKEGRDVISQADEGSGRRSGSVGRSEGRNKIQAEPERLLAAIEELTDYETFSLGPPRPDFTSSDQIVFAPQKSLKAGSMPRCFDWIVDNCYDLRSQLPFDFLAAYRQWLAPRDLFKLFYDKYTGDATRAASAIVPIRKKVIALFLRWVELWLLRDFFERRGYLFKKLLDFLPTLASTGFPNAAYRCKLVLVKNRVRIAAKQQERKTGKPSRKEKEKGVPPVDILNVEPALLTDQLTLIESELFSSINLAELFNLTWKGKGARQYGAKISTLVERFNLVSFWVATEVVMASNQKSRVAVILHFLQVARRCFEMGNYNTLMEVLAGLGHVSVTRLKRTWAELPPKAHASLAELNTLMDSKHNYRAYRETLAARRTGPVLPYLGITLRDVAFIEEGNPNLVSVAEGLPAKLVNFEKLQLLAGPVREMSRHQAMPFRFVPLPSLHRYLTRLTRFPDEVLYQHSLRAEPKETQPQS